MTNISTRSVSLIVGMVVCAAMAIGIFQYYAIKHDQINQEAHQIGFLLDKADQQFGQVVENMRKNALVLAETPPIQGIIRSSRNGGIDPKDRSTIRIWKDRLAQIFKSMAMADPNLVQIRFIGAADNGLELVRVNRQRGKVTVVPQSQLQEKGSVDYVTETLAAARGDVIVSDINLNREHGEIEVPIVPVLRVSTPVFADDGTMFGLIVLNVNMTPVLQRMTDLVQTSTRSFYLTNAAGDYLAHPDPEKEFGFDLGRNHRLQDDFKALAPIMADKARKTATEIIGINGDQTIVSMDRLYMSPNKPSQYLVALGMSPMANLLVNNVQQRNQVILLTIVLAVIGGLAGLILARLIVRPLRQLTIAAGELALGADFDKVAIPVHRSDEVGVLARAFRNMAQTIKARQEALEDERARSTAVLETALSPIITINDRGIIQDANPATTRLFGYKRGELIGQNVKMLMTSKDRDNHDNYLETYHKTRIPKIMGNGREVTAQRKDGTTVPVHLAVSELHLKDRVMFTGIITDMTEHKKVDKLKNEFVSTVSHELRTPLTSIKGSLGLLQSAVLGELPPQMKSMIGIAYSNSDRLVRLINDILDIEKIEAGKLTFDFQRTDLKPLLERIIDANRGYGQGKRVSIELLPMTARPFVEADPDRLTQVITNFLSNAIKFSPEGGTVQVSAAVAGGTVRVSVTDHGPGISEEFQGKIFGKFAQEDSSSTKAQGGTGLGLAISKAIVEAHGGTIDFSSEIDKGTTFFFEIAELSTARTATVDTSPEDREKILICEDDADMATLLRLIVSDMGYEGVICSDARTAKDALSGNRFVAMTVDLALPGQDGISLIRDLRDDPETESLPVIVVSARAQDGRVEADTAAYRVIDWLEKPIDVNRLRAGLTNAVKDFASERPRILYVDDDTDHLFVVSSLVGANTVIDTATTCVQARDLLNRHDYDLVLLDLILPDGDGESLLHLIDANGDRAPQVIVFSVKDLPESFAGKVDRRLIKSRTSNSALKDQIEKLLARRKHREQEFRLAKSEPKRTEVMEESGVD